MEMYHVKDGYDVVIAGAGPAGAQCARDLAARNYDVVVLEVEPEDEFPKQSNKSTGGTFPRMLRSFGIPDDVVMNSTDSVVLESPSHHTRWDRPGAVLDFAAFKRFLVEDSRSRGVEYRFGSRVNAPIMEDGKIVGVRYNKDEEVYGNVIIDATGPNAPLAKALGVSDLEPQNHAVGIEYEFEGIHLDYDGYADLTDAMMLRLDHDYAPGGYAWIFHTGADTAKVGVCYLQREGFETFSQRGMTIEDYLTQWLEDDPRFESAVKKEGTTHRGSAHLQAPGSLSTDNFIAIGDTVPTVDPLWGEGIHKGMRTARAAARTIGYCNSPHLDDTSAACLSRYDDDWHQKIASDASNRLLASETLFTLSNKRYDMLLADLNRLDSEALFKASRGDVRSLVRLIHLRDVPLLPKLAWKASRA